MKTYSFEHCPDINLLALIDAGHRRLPAGSYYVELLHSRYARNRTGILAFVYVKVVSTGTEYSIGISGREEDSLVFRMVNSLPEGAIVWAEITTTKQGYSRIARMEIVVGNGLSDPSAFSKLCWDFACRGRVSMSLRVPWIFQPGTLSEPRIAVVWQNPRIEFYAADFTEPSTQWPELLSSTRNLAAAMVKTPRRKFMMAGFLDFLHGQEPLFDPQQTGGLSVGDRIGSKAPFSVMHYFLSPVASEGGVKHCRSRKQPLVSEPHFLQIMMRLWRPQLVILGGAEVARALPKLLRPITHDGFYQLPRLTKVCRDSLNPLDIVRQEFEKRWSADFIVVHDLSYFGKGRIGSRVLAPDYWHRAATHIKDAIGNLAAPRYSDSDAYSKSTGTVDVSDEPAVEVDLSEF